MPKFTRQEVDRIWALQKQREADERERLRQVVALSEAPLSPEIVDAVIKLNDTHARDILRSHKGFPLAERRDSYLTSLAILDSSVEDLLSTISVFEKKAVADQSDLFRRDGEINRIQRRIQKELFAATNAAASVVDHARRVVKCHDLPEYETKRIECFGTDGMHEFVIALRVMLHHLHIVGAGYLTTHDFRTGKKTATFTINKQTVQRVIASAADRFARRSDAPMLAFVQAAPESIDLRELFSDYAARASKLHKWMKGEIASQKFTALRDYDRIIQEKKNFDNRLFWKALMGNWLNWKVPPDPHNHLPRFLDAAQLAEVYKLPRNSRDQVDLVITYMDKNNAIDVELRQMAYALFERSPQLGAAS